MSIIGHRMSIIGDGCLSLKADVYHRTDVYHMRRMSIIGNGCLS